MKHFQVPYPVKGRPLKAATDPNLPPPPAMEWTFLRAATLLWLEDTRPTQTPDGKGFSIVKQRRWIKVIDKFEAASAGDWISLDDEDYAALKIVVESPSRSFAAADMIATMPFADAILAAVDELPATHVNGTKAAVKKEARTAP